MDDKFENPDWLPPDWTVTVKYRKDGRMDKYYIHPSNGRKLSSKVEVLRYLKSCSSEIEKPKERNKAYLETTSAEELPPGWIKEIRTVKKHGRTVKEPCYIDPVSGREFQSLQEVFNYIKILESDQIKHKSDEEDHNTLKLEDHSQSASAELINKKADTTISRCKSVKSGVEVGGSVGSAVTIVAVGKNTKVVNKDKDDSLTMEHSDQQPFSRAERYAHRTRKREMGDKFEHPDWLPPDWTVTVKFRNYGRKDKYYIHPSNGRKLSSKVEVLRYLKSCSSEIEKPKEKHKAYLETTSAEELPPGWIKEIRTVKKRGRTVKEPCYVDPVSGREFQSLQEVFNYIKILESDQIKHKSDEEDHNTLKLEDHSQSASAELINKKADTTISRCKSVKSGVEVGGSVGSAVTIVAVGKNTKVVNKDKDDSLTMEHSDQQPFSRAERYAHRTRKREIDGGCHISKSDDAVKELDAPETSSSKQTREHNFLGDQQEENVANPPNTTKQTNRKSAGAELPRRASKRLANVEVGPSIKIKPTKKHRITSSTLPIKVHQVSTTDDNGLNGSLDKEIIVTGDIGNLDEPNQQTYMNSISDAQKELVRSLFEDPCCSEDFGGVCVEIKDDEKHEQQVEPALENLLMDPCYGFAIKTLKGDIPIDDVKEVDNNIMCSLASPNEAPASSSSVLPAGNIWDDPSFEFAVKMLTSNSPTEDSSHFSISFNESHSSSGASGYNNNSSLALPKKTRLGDSNHLFNGFDSEMNLPQVPHNTVHVSSSQQFQPVATGLKGLGNKYGNK